MINKNLPTIDLHRNLNPEECADLQRQGHRNAQGLQEGADDRGRALLHGLVRRAGPLRRAAVPDLVGNVGSRDRTGGS